jgi:alpha-galactosidase
MKKHYSIGLNTLAIIFLIGQLFSCKNATEKSAMEFSSKVFELNFPNTKEVLWQYKEVKTGKTLDFNGPSFEIDGKTIGCELFDIQKIGEPIKLNIGVTEYVVQGAFKHIPDLFLRIIFRIPDNNPVVRFRYELIGSGNHTLTKSKGNDNIQYLSFSVSEYSKIKEVKLSEFNEMVHSFCLSEREMDLRNFNNQTTFMGPIVVGGNDQHSFLVAYEHGSQAPDLFLNYALSSNKTMALNAVKGNYFNGFPITTENPYQSIWLEAAFIQGNEDQLAENYRQFILRHMSPNLESRKPYIFYNTWNFQERNKHWYKKPYLADMTMERMLQEIEVAHQIGIEVFVIDAGWFEKTGDWQPSKTRFPDELKQIKAKLDAYGMKLGLWFNPTVAAKSSTMFANNKKYMQTYDGKVGNPFPVWETEESYGMCLVSQYRDAFADELIRLAKEVGVRYFKWDAIGQYGCNDPNHFHGTAANSSQERADCYAFEIGRSMNYVVDKLCSVYPDAIVDFDITEGGRTVGLGFLASGKYFLINNGPYYQNYDVPIDPNKDNWNIFFYPGAARTWICRTPLTFDKWIPSVLFLTHYLPDDPYEYQSIAVGSLILGQNGIWGDLLKISPEGLGFFNQTLGYYKQVRDDITKATIVRDGAVGGSPEVYEKINKENGKGAMVVFSSHKGSYEYVSKNKPNQKYWSTKGVNITIDKDGYAVIKVNFDKAEAKIIFFGVN